MPGVPTINPLDDYKTTFDLFYQFVKKEIGNLKTNQYIQLRATAEPLDAKVAYPWFSYYTYLLKTDTTLEPIPLTDDLSKTDISFTDEYERFINAALEFVEEKQLDPKTIQKINDLGVKRQNIKYKLKVLVKEDRADWRDYCDQTGLQYGDRAAYVQWSNSYGNWNEIDAQTKEMSRVDGDLARLRNKVYANPDEKEIKDAYDIFVSSGSRIRYPQRPDTEYSDGKNFNIGYLAALPFGDTALFADRHVIFPQLSLDTITSGSIGGDSFTIDKSTQATESMSSDWGAGGSGGYGWFSISVNTSSSTQVSQEFRSTTNIKLLWKSLFSAEMITNPWFKPNIFKNQIIKKHANAFVRFFGPGGTLLYYPRALIVMRGMRITFKSTNYWRYDYVHDFQAGGSGGLNFFGYKWGANASVHEHEEKHTVEQNGDELIFDDGENSLRVIGFVVQKNQELHAAIMDPLFAAYSEIEKGWNKR